jgi:hypothetical protein
MMANREVPREVPQVGENSREVPRVVMANREFPREVPRVGENICIRCGNVGQTAESFSNPIICSRCNKEGHVACTKGLYD